MITLVLGGTRSGKSQLAESLASELGSSVTYVATADVVAADADHVARVERHRARRPAPWVTIETAAGPDLDDVLRRTPGPVLVDSLGTWLTSHHDFDADLDALVDALLSRSDPAILVSEEVGLAVHPPTELGRRYVDAVGTMNQRVAAVADRVLFVVAGRALDLS